MRLELVTKTIGVGKYENLTNEEILASIARHGVIKNDNGRLVQYLMKEKHWSPLDMINFTFEVETSRAIARQWLRHSSIKPQEHSQRYSDRVLFEDIELRLEHPTNRQSSTELVATIHNNLESGEPLGVHNRLEKVPQHFLKRMENLLIEIQDVYKQGIEFGIAKECMRNILPECTTTTLTFNGSLRSWLSFLNVRCDHHSQKEIVVLATQVGEILEQELPNVFAQIDWRKGMFM